MRHVFIIIPCKAHTFLRDSPQRFHSIYISLFWSFKRRTIIRRKWTRAANQETTTLAPPPTRPVNRYLYVFVTNEGVIWLSNKTARLLIGYVTSGRPDLGYFRLCDQWPAVQWLSPAMVALCNSQVVGVDGGKTPHGGTAGIVHSFEIRHGYRYSCW